MSSHHGTSDMFFKVRQSLTGEGDQRRKVSTLNTYQVFRLECWKLSTPSTQGTELPREMSVEKQTPSLLSHKSKYHANIVHEEQSFVCVTVLKTANSVVWCGVVWSCVLHLVKCLVLHHDMARQSKVAKDNPLYL